MGHQQIRTMQFLPWYLQVSGHNSLEGHDYVQLLLCSQGLPKLVLCQCFLGTDLTFKTEEPSCQVQLQGVAISHCVCAWRSWNSCLFQVKAFLLLHHQCSLDRNHGFLLQFFLHFNDNFLFLFILRNLVCCGLCGKPWRLQQRMFHRRFSITQVLSHR